MLHREKFKKIMLKVRLGHSCFSPLYAMLLLTKKISTLQYCLPYNSNNIIAVSLKDIKSIGLEA